MKTQTLREYIATRGIDEQENFWNAPAKPMSEIVKHREFWTMIWHRHIKHKIYAGAAVTAFAIAAYIIYLR